MIYIISVSINRMLISQLKRFLYAKFMFHLDSMFNLAFISYFYAVVICVIQTFQPKDALLLNSRWDVITLAACIAITQHKILWEVTLFII